MNLIISRKFDSENSWDIKIVLNELKTEITAQEKTVLVWKQIENVPRWIFLTVCYSLLLGHQEKLPIFCLFCKKPHKRQNCRIVSDIRTTKNIVGTSKRCFVCLKGSHLAKYCYSKIKYFKCSKRHYVALCDSGEGGHSSNSSSVVNITGVDDNTNILLQTTKVIALFGSCSQLSSITSQLRNRLKLKTVGTQKISIQTFRTICSENI